MNVLFDAGSLINLANGQVLECIVSDPAWTSHLSPLVRDECKSISNELNALIHTGVLVEVPDLGFTAQEFADVLAKFDLGVGETECLINMQATEYIVSCDDAAARKTLSTLYGADRVTGTLGLLILAVRGGAISLDAAFASYQLMRAAGGFLPALSAADFEALI